MKNVLAIFLAVSLPAANVAAQEPYTWSISNSATRSDYTVGPIETGSFSLYLWYMCSWFGMSAAVFDLAVPEGATNLGFTPMNGFLNVGDDSHLLLAVGACPYAPMVAGTWTFVCANAGVFCLVDSKSYGMRATIDCDVPVARAWPMDVGGYQYGGDILYCYQPWCVVTAVQPTPWGRTKALYR